MSILGGLLGSLFSFGAAGASSAMQYAMSSAGQKRQYEYQRKLNIQQNELQKSLNQWNAQNIPLYSRQGMETAGFNPILAINSGSAFSAGGNAQGGSAASPNPVQAPDITGAIDSVANAYKTFKLEKELNAKQQELLDAQKLEALARVRNLDKDTELKPFDKPLKVVGDILSNPDIPSNVKTTVTGIVVPQVNSAKKHASRAFWNFYDWMNDNATYLKWNAKNFGGYHMDRKYFDGISKRLRIQKGIYNRNQLKYQPHIN